VVWELLPPPQKLIVNAADFSYWGIISTGHQDRGMKLFPKTTAGEENAELQSCRHCSSTSTCGSENRPSLSDASQEIPSYGVLTGQDERQLIQVEGQPTGVLVENQLDGSDTARGEN